MGKPTGFLEYERETAKKRPVEERVKDARELSVALDGAVLKEQAARCMDCGVPFCHWGCPLGNLIPDWNDLVYRGAYGEAAARLEQTNNFPELTGRLCPAPCEAACVAGLHGDAVAIKEVERAIADRAWAEGLYAPRVAATKTGHKVAIVGSGPAGLACAQELAREGHSVVVFERADKPGGLLRYGIPDFKLEREVLDRRLDQLRAEGVELRCGVDVGRDLSADDLTREFDVIALATGALAARRLDVPGDELPGIHFALSYLEQENRAQAGEAIDEAARITAKGKRVLILGGGDTGADCLGTAHRQGAAEVVQLEIAPRPPEKRGNEDPWPLWPNVFRTSPAHEEGGTREFALRTLRLEAGLGGAVARLVAERVAWREGQIVSLGEEVAFDAELVLIATGYTGPEPSPLYAALGAALDVRGRLAGDEHGRTERASLFVMGDARRGASLIVHAIAEGRRAARSISEKLAGKRLLRSA